MKLWKKKKLKLPKPTKMKKFKGKGYQNGTKAPPGSQHFKKPKKQLVDCTDEKLMLQLLEELLLPNGMFIGVRRKMNDPNGQKWTVQRKRPIYFWRLESVQFYPSRPSTFADRPLSALLDLSLSYMTVHFCTFGPFSSTPRTIHFDQMSTLDRTLFTGVWRTYS